MDLGCHSGDGVPGFVEAALLRQVRGNYSNAVVSRGAALGLVLIILEGGSAVLIMQSKIRNHQLNAPQPTLRERLFLHSL
jgi:hypothetical protein